MRVQDQENKPNEGLPFVINTLKPSLMKTVRYALLMRRFREYLVLVSELVYSQLRTPSQTRGKAD